MPLLSQWMVRTALIYLILGFTFGGLLLTHKGIPLHPSLWAWLPAHIEFLLMGWIVQLTMGSPSGFCHVTGKNLTGQESLMQKLLIFC